MLSFMTEVLNIIQCLYLNYSAFDDVGLFLFNCSLVGLVLNFIQYIYTNCNLKFLFSELPLSVVTPCLIYFQNYFLSKSQNTSN
jgi:hypothetical protein